MTYQEEIQKIGNLGGWYCPVSLWSLCM